MYTLSSDQVNFIQDDIRARGIQMDSLQDDLLDHVCCIIEHNLEENGDFKNFYETTIKTFFKKELVEIEEETQSLITNKHYYTMKKLMIASGSVSAIILSAGIILKFLHMPGAGICVVLGITILSLIFLPLLFTLKIKEKQKTRDKLLLGLVSFIAILFTMAVMFKLMHWPWANVMGLTSIALLALVYVPLHLITGIRQAETKMNTIVSSIILIAACGLFMGLVRSPGASKVLNIKNTAVFVKGEQILENENKQVTAYLGTHEIDPEVSKISKEIYLRCAQLKSMILENETGYKKLDADFESKNAWIEDGWVGVYLKPETKGEAKAKELKTLAAEYNAKYSGEDIIPLESSIFELKDDRILNLLNDLTQLQMVVLQNQMALAK